MPVRNKSASLRASTLSLLLPSFNKALRRGLQTRTWCTWGCSRSYNQAAQVPSSQVTCSSPCSPWINCRMLLALVSTIASITIWPLLFSTAITIASLCTSIPIYLTSRLILSCLLGGKLIRPTSTFPQGNVPLFNGLAYPLLRFSCHHADCNHSERRRSGAEPCTAQRSEGGVTPGFDLLKQGALS